ncbi:MFS transporter [Saccharopolyspora sp. NPDC002686]|uniref:MFS transporter n=1 Tax=Saccharopolyspora sp. NPDC002686 TaxID=3154541 RepID=UPI003316D8F2
MPTTADGAGLDHLPEWWPFEVDVTAIAAFDLPKSGLSRPRVRSSCRMKGKRMTHPESDKASRRSKSADLTSRLDRLPAMAPHVIWISILAANLALEFYDNALFAYITPAIQEHAGLTLAQIGAVTTAFFVGMIVGGLVGGRIADRFGRRSVIAWSTALYSLGALATALSANFEVMVLARVVTGIGAAAATSVLLVYVAEMFPSKTRGRFVSILNFGFVVIAPVIALLVLLAIPHGGPDTWRHLFLIGSCALVIAPLVRFAMPESVRWHLSRGQLDAAEKIVEKLEARALRRGPLPEPSVIAGETRRPSLREVFGNKRMIGILLVVSVGFFGSTLGYYLFQNWALYSLVYGLNYPETDAYWIQLVWNVVYCVTPFIALLFMDRIERKTVIFATSVITAVPLVLLGVSPSSWVVIASGGAAAIVTGLVVIAFYTYIPETMPTEVRGLGSGIVLSVGRVGGAASGFLGAAFFASWGMGGVMVAAAVAYVVSSVLVVLFGPRTAKRPLEGVAAEELGTATYPRTAAAAGKAPMRETNE